MILFLLIKENVDLNYVTLFCYGMIRTWQIKIAVTTVLTCNNHTFFELVIRSSIYKESSFPLFHDFHQNSMLVYAHGIQNNQILLTSSNLIWLLFH